MNLKCFKIQTVSIKTMNLHFYVLIQDEKDILLALICISAHIDIMVGVESCVRFS